MTVDYIPTRSAKKFCRDRLQITKEILKYLNNNNESFSKFIIKCLKKLITGFIKMAIQV